MKTNKTTFLILFITIFIWLESPLKAQKLDLESGQIVFNASTQIERYSGTTTAISGSLDFDEQAFSFTVLLDSISTGNSTRDRKMREDHLETATYPKATFSGKLTQISDLSDAQAIPVTANGIFKLHGVEKDMNITGYLTQDGESYRLEATFPILLSDFDIKTPRFLFVRVRDEHKVIVSLTF